MKFKIDEWIENREKPEPQKFGNPKIMRAGKELDVREWIDAGREDTELYPTLEKYGCIDRMIVNKEQVFGDLTSIMGLRDSIEQMKQANQLWESLPLDFRKEFLNDKNEFMRNGMNYLKKKIDAEIAEKDTLKKQADVHREKMEKLEQAQMKQEM